MNKKGISTTLIVGIVVVVLVVAAIGVYLYTRPPPTPKIGLVMATGGLGDKSFNDISYAGVQRAEEDLGIEFDYAQPEAIAEYEGYQTDFARSGNYILIVCIGFDQADALNKTAAEYPNQKFAIVDMVVDQPNVASLLFKANEASFLVGVTAGMKTVTGKVGFVGGMDNPLIRDFFEGYEAGAKWANTSVTVVSPVFVEAWDNPATGRELAQALAEAGVDTIYAAAGRSGLGALEVVHVRGLIGLGVDACQCYLYPDQMIASMTKRVDNAVYEMIEAALNNEFESGIKNGGLKEGWVGLCRLPNEEVFWETKFAFTHKLLEQEVIDKIVDAKNKIIALEIDVPSGYD